MLQKVGWDEFFLNKLDNFAGKSCDSDLETLFLRTESKISQTNQINIIIQIYASDEIWSRMRGIDGAGRGVVYRPEV